MLKKDTKDDPIECGYILADWNGLSMCVDYLVGVKTDIGWMWEVRVNSISHVSLGRSK